MIIHFPLLIEVCNYFCFAGIVVETNCTLSIVDEIFVFFLYECAHPAVQLLYVLFSLVPVRLLQWSNDVVLDPQQSVYVCRSLCVSLFLCVTRFSVCDTFFCVCVTVLCGETSRDSSVSKEELSPLNVFGSHEYRLILCLHFYRFQILF